MNQNNKTFHLAQFNLKPSIKLSQILSYVPLDSNDVVVEIGAGKGQITKYLLPKIKKCITYEIDKSLQQDLDQLQQTYQNLEIKWENFLTAQLPKDPYKIVANIPFNQTRHIIEKIFFAETLPTLQALILQKEVSEKIARPPTQNTLLSAFILSFYTAEIKHQFQRSDYSPEAHVDTTLLLLQLKLSTNPINRQQYLHFLTTLFDSPGQPLKNRLKKIFTYTQIKKIALDYQIKLEKGPHSIPPQTYLGLYQLYRKLSPQKSK